MTILEHLLFLLTLAQPPRDPPEDLLGDIVVAAKEGDTSLPARVRLHLRAEDSDSAKWLDAVAWDLELFGTFRVEVSTDDAPAARPSRTMTLSYEGEELTLTLAGSDGEADRSQSLRVAASDHRTPHRVADAALELLTGTPGAMVVALGGVERLTGHRRAVELTLADPNPAVLSGEGEVVSSVTYALDGSLIRVASINSGAYRVQGSLSRPLGRGSVFGLAIGAQGALAISQASSNGIRVLLYAPGREVPVVLRGTMGLQPVFSGRGRLAYVGTLKKLRRVLVYDEPVSSPGRDAQSPTFCSHPRGERLAWTERVGGEDVVIVADARGRHPVQLGAAWSRITAVACSPDGRLLAVAGTRDHNRGVYVGNLDRWVPQLISPASLDSLHWGRPR